jgi:hypothetical protein
VRPDAADPHEWLRRARSNLERARVRTPNTCLEDACFDAQQSAEKSIKATRYPGLSPSVLEEQWVEAIALAAAVLLWAEGVIGLA